MMTKIRNLIIAASFISLQVSAQVTDEVHFGDQQSEKAHGLTTYYPEKTEIYTGLLSQSARRFSPDNMNPFQGQYTGIYGGEINMIMKIDGDKQNYFTLKASGSESWDGRILMEVEGFEVGNRYHDSEEFFFGEFFNAASGAFIFRTLPIPRVLTDGKTEVRIRLRSTGRFYGYGGGGYESFQRAMESKSSGMFKLFSHTDPGFNVNNELSGSNAPSYGDAPANSATGLNTLKSEMSTAANSYFRGLINGSDYIASDPNNYFHPVEALAQAYFTPEISVTYQKQEVVDKLFRLIDNMVINYYAGGQQPGASWGGAYGRQGYALAMLYDKISQDALDEKVNLGGGTNVTRRNQWCTAFRASFNSGAGSRKTITNQLMENDASVYGAALALYKLNSGTYSKYPAIGLRLLRESCGLEEFSGVVTSLGTTNPQLGMPSSSDKGAGYYFMTEKGTSHEPGWVSADCYGNLGGKIMEMYMMTKVGLGGDGDLEVLQKGVQHVKAQSLFTIPFTTSGKKDVLTEGWICHRNVDIPGDRFYGNASVAGISGDADLLGYMRQQIDEGNMTFGSFTATSTQYVFSAIEALEQGSYTTQMPTLPSQPDFVFADEENGIVSIKNEDEQLFFNFYCREKVNAQVVKLHHVTPTTQRFVEIKPIKNEYRGTGIYYTRTGWVNGFLNSYGTPPDNPVSALIGQKEEYNSYDGTNKYNGGRYIKDYYLAHYGRYIIAMNTLKNTDKTIEFPAEFVGKQATQLDKGTILTIPASMTIPGRSTYVFFLDEEVSGKAEKLTSAATTDRSELIALVAEKEIFTQASETRTNISLISEAGKYKPALFLEFMRELSYAKYIAYKEVATATEVSGAQQRLETAYQNLTGDIYSYDNVVLPGQIDVEKKIATNGSIKFDTNGGIGETKNGSYFVVPVQALETGRYTFTISASTTRSQNLNPRINIDLLEDGTDFSNRPVNEDNSRSIQTTSSWSDMNDYHWYIDLNAGDQKLMKVTFLVGDGSWAQNIASITATVSGEYDLLQGDILNANILLDRYSNRTTALYSKVSDEERQLLSEAITIAEEIASSATDEEINNAREALVIAVEIFENAIYPYSGVPGIFEFISYNKKSGTITVNSSDIGSTTNGATLTFKVKAQKSGTYIPYIVASTNTESNQSPRIGIAISTNESSLFTSTEWTKTIIKGVNGWNSFSRYEYPIISLTKGNEYFFKLFFYSSSNWVANLNEIGMELKDASAIESTSIANNDVLVYPNPAKDYIHANTNEFNEINNVQIYNLMGKMLIQQTVVNGEPISVSSLLPGVYIVRVLDNKTSKAKTSKLIIE